MFHTAVRAYINNLFMKTTVTRKGKADSAVTKHLKDNSMCIDQQLTKHFKIIGRARDQNHLDLLKALLIKKHLPVLCQQKDFVVF